MLQSLYPSEEWSLIAVHSLAPGTVEKNPGQTCKLVAATRRPKEGEGGGGRSVVVLLTGKIYECVYTVYVCGSRRTGII